MAEKKAIQEAIEDLKFMANKQTEPLQRIAFNMAITICEQHLPKELDGEQHLKQMINTYEKAGHKIGVPPDELDKEAKELVFSNDDLDRIGNVKLIKFLLGRIGVLKPKNESQEVAIEAIKSMITETDYFGNGKSLIHIENENAGSLEYALNKFHAINDTDLQPRAMQPTEAQRLIDMFYEKMAFQSTELRRHEITKQCAIIHCDLMIKRLPSELHYYTTLKQKIEAL